MLKVALACMPRSRKIIVAMMEDCMQLAPKSATKQALKPCFIDIERENHNPLVGGSNPSAATILESIT
jgi:hypothetical protein